MQSKPPSPGTGQKFESEAIQTMATHNRMHLLSDKPTWNSKVSQPAAWLMVGIAALLSWTITTLPAAAQFSNGAVIVTVPSDNDEPATKPALSAPPKPRRTTRPAAKPKRSTARRRPARRPARAARRTSTSADKLKIAVLVNDDPITHYEISQRASLLAGRAGIGKRAQANFKSLIKRKSTNARLRAILKETIDANRGRSRQQILAIFDRRKKAYAKSLQRQAVSMARNSLLPGLQRKATQELIDERLKIQAAKQAKMLATDAQLDSVMRGIAKRNKIPYKAFAARLKKQGTDIQSMRSRIRAQMSWMRLVNAKFGRFVDVNQKTIDETIIGGSNASSVSLHLHRLLFHLPAKIDQKIVAARMVEADQLRATFKSCSDSRTLAASHRDVVFQDMGYRVAAQIEEPTRSLLLNARDGEMAPPLTTRNGVALYAVCGRRVGTKSFEARAAAERNLRQQSTEIYGRKYLGDLRREAHIEYRAK